MEAPTEFRYLARRDRPKVRALRLALRAALGFDPAPADSVVERFAASYFDGDPLAEAFVAEAGGQARALLDAALASPAGARHALPSLAALVEDVERPPPWLDLARLALGARVFRGWGVDVFRFAGAITAGAYRESSVAKPLALTGAYAGSSARRRFLETASFWIDVSEPGGLRRGAPGFAAALRVRVMHGALRRRLLAHPEWDRAAWGVPISQGDALLTLLGGSLAPGVALRLLGYRTGRREIEATLHFWRYVGHLMGFRSPCFPETLEDAARLSFVALLKGAGTGGDDGRMLARGYVLAFAPGPDASAEERLEHALHVGTSRLFVPPSMYRDAGLPPAGASVLLPLARAPLVALGERARRLPALDRALDSRARVHRRHWLDRQLGAEPARFRPAESLRATSP